MLAALQYETQCCFETASFEDFCEWESQSNAPTAAAAKYSRNPLLLYDRNEYFCYADYKYLFELDADSNCLSKLEILNLNLYRSTFSWSLCFLANDFDWSVFGLDKSKNEETTFWLGSTGAYTVCHYDTYGWNIVAQLYGR